MADETSRGRASTGELIGTTIFVLVLLGICGVVATGAYLRDSAETTRWVLCGVGVVLVTVGVALARNCILGLMGVLMTCVGAGFVIGNVAAFLFPRVV